MPPWRKPLKGALGPVNLFWRALATTVCWLSLSAVAGPSMKRVCHAKTCEPSVGSFQDSHILSLTTSYLKDQRNHTTGAMHHSHVESQYGIWTIQNCLRVVKSAKGKSLKQSGGSDSGINHVGLNILENHFEVYSRSLILQMYSEYGTMILPFLTPLQYTIGGKWVASTVLTVGWRSDSLRRRS